MQIDINATLRGGVSAHEAGDLATAEAAYRRILDAAPAHADARHLLGLIRFQGGDHTGAVEMIRAAIAENAEVALYHGNLGRILKAQNRDGDAVKALRNAVRLAPETAAYHADLASALLGMGDPDAARARALLALDKDPDLAEAHLNLGLALQELHGPANAEAMAALVRARELKPGLAGAYLGLGVGLHDMGNSKDARAAYTHALELNPGYVEAHCNLGNLARDDCDFEAAIGHYRDALALREDLAEVWGNLGVAYQESGRAIEALQALDRAVTLRPDFAEVRRNRGMALLAAGRFAEGWEDYEYRWETERFRPLLRKWRVPLWDGRDFAGKHLLVHAEQGRGDTLQFCRYLKLMAERGARITLECPDALAPLLAGLPGVVRVIPPGTSIPSVDARVPLMSLPHRFATTLETIPADIPYLSPPPTALRKWATRMADWPAGKRIGIAWRGSPTHPRDHLRSPGLAPFLKLADDPDVVLVSLQKDGGAEDLASVGVDVVDPMRSVSSFADTAGLMMNLDAVVSCDSAPLHLAGALGVPAVAVLPHVAEWRWGIEGDTTPWYPGMTLVRQPAPGDWAGAMAEAAKIIAAR